MSDNESDQEFWDIADNFINFANDQMEKADGEKVSAALLYAAARFNAFIIASLAEDDLASEKSSAINFFSKEYRQALSDSLDEYESDSEEDDETS